MALEARLRMQSLLTWPSDSVSGLWESFRAAIRDLCLRADIRSFLCWDVIQRTMFVGYARYLRTELAWLQRRQDWHERWSRVLRATPYGRAPRFPFFPRSSGNHIHQAYHLAKFEAATGRSVATFQTILEFGGGYGALCNLAFRSGFCGRYIILDLPELCVLQRYYLGLVGVPLLSDNFEHSSGVLLTDRLGTALETAAAGASPRLFVATWSMSEAPIGYRKELETALLGSDGLLIAFQEEFEGSDNRDYFAQLQQRAIGNGICCVQLPIPHIPHNYYIFGVRRV